MENRNMFDQDRHKKVVSTFSWIGMGVLLIFGVENWLEGQAVVATIEIGMMIVLGMNLLIYRLHRKSIVTAYIATLVILGLLLLMYITGGIRGTTGVYWFFLFPVIAYYLLDKVGAYTLISTLIFSTISLYIAGKMGWVSVAYGLVETRQLLVSFAVEAILMGLYQKATGEYESEFEAQRMKLNKINQEMQKVVDVSNKGQIELKAKNEEMEKSKLAMLNLLEDARSLEKQLKEEKMSVEKIVAERTSELTAVIDSINRGLIVVNSSREIILKNKMMRELLNKSENCSYSEVVEFLRSKVDLEKMVTDCFAQKKDFVVDPELFGNRYLHVHVVPILQEGEVDSVAIFIKDTTEATAMQRSRDEFFSIASHELRTPLTAIRGNAGMILDNYKDKLPDKDIVEMLNDIHEGSERLITIVNDFLNVSRLEMGKMEFKKDALDIGEVIESVIKEFEVTGSRQKIQIELQKADKALPKVLGDSDRIKQILINLVGNGLKFMSEGTIKIVPVVNGSEMQIEVSDTGEGIPKEVQGLLFHKFQQAGSSLYTRDTSKGTGLGLYISKLMVEGMGGKIWLVKSELGQGTTFAFSLPIAKTAEV